MMGEVTETSPQALADLASEANAHARKAGEALEAAKGQVEHGEWTPWRG